MVKYETHVQSSTTNFIVKKLKCFESLSFWAIVTLDLRPLIFLPVYLKLVVIFVASGCLLRVGNIGKTYFM